MPVPRQGSDNPTPSSDHRSSSSEPTSSVAANQSVSETEKCNGAKVVAPAAAAAETNNNVRRDPDAGQAKPHLPTLHPPRRPYLTKFATIHADKYPQNLRREFPTTNFDRNLTVEKARFDPQPLAIPHHPYDSPPPEHLPHAASPPTTCNSPNTITPSASSTALSAAARAKPAKSRGEGERSSRSTRRRRRPPPPVSGAATPAEVFHRNLVDAVSNVEDSDENEQYVYSYGGTAMDHPSYHHPDLLYRTQSMRSTATGSQQLQDNTNRSSFGNFLSDLFRPWRTRVAAYDEETAAVAGEAEESEQAHRRPKLRNHVMDRRPKDVWDGRLWYDKHPVVSQPPPPPTSLPRRQRVYPAGTDGYSTDDEGAPLMRRSGRLRRSAEKKHAWSRVCLNLTFGIIFLIFCGICVLAYRAKPLTDIKVSMGRVLASDKELIFDLHVKANNWNWWTVHVADADISLFAFSQVVPLGNGTVAQGVDPAEYLGSFYHFDEPLSFPSSLLSQTPVEASSQIRIKSPGVDNSGNEKWSRIIRYPYGLVARGVLKYRPLPVGGYYHQSAAICDVVNVQPTSGEIMEDPDQSYCLKDSKKLAKKELPR